MPEPAAHARWRVQRLLEPNPMWGSNGVAFGPDGRLYAAQYLAGQISAVDTATGEAEVVVPMDGPVQTPDDLAFGADGSMYIADLVPGRVWRRSPLGVYTLVSDKVQVPNGITCVGDRLFVNEMKRDGRLLELSPDSGDSRTLTDGLALGNAMQLGPDNHLYYPHMVTGQVWRIRPDGGSPELVAKDVHEPVAVRFDQGGALLVLSRGQAGIVTRIDLHGTGSRSLLTSGLAGLDNAAFDAENRMFVSSYASGGITELHPDGRTREIVRRGLDGPFGVTIDLAGTVHAADHYRIADPERGAAAQEDDGPAHVLRPFAHGVTTEGRTLHLTSQYGEVRTYDPQFDTTRVRASGLRRPLGIGVRASGELIVAETDAGRVITLDDEDSVAVLAEDLKHPVDVALDADGACYVSDDQLGAVCKVENGRVIVIAEGLDAPQGMVVVDEELFTVETGARRLLAISLTTGERSVEAEELAVGRPVATTQPALFTHDMPGVPLPFAGLSATSDGSLLLSANGEGTVLRLSPRTPRADSVTGDDLRPGPAVRSAQPGERPRQRVPAAGRRPHC